MSAKNIRGYEEELQKAINSNTKKSLLGIEPDLILKPNSQLLDGREYKIRRECDKVVILNTTNETIVMRGNLEAITPNTDKALVFGIRWIDNDMYIVGVQGRYYRINNRIVPSMFRPGQEWEGIATHINDLNSSRNSNLVPHSGTVGSRAEEPYDLAFFCYADTYISLAQFIMQDYLLLFDKYQYRDKRGQITLKRKCLNLKTMEELFQPVEWYWSEDKDNLEWPGIICARQGILVGKLDNEKWIFDNTGENSIFMTDCEGDVYNYHGKKIYSGKCRIQGTIGDFMKLKIWQTDNKRLTLLDMD
jgi:hypothetical protein